MFREDPEQQPQLSPQEGWEVVDAPPLWAWESTSETAARLDAYATLAKVGDSTSLHAAPPPPPRSERAISVNVRAATPVPWPIHNDKTPRTVAPLHLDDDPIGPPIELAPEDMFDEGYDEDFTQVDHDLLTQPMEAIVLELEAVPADEWE